MFSRFSNKLLRFSRMRKLIGLVRALRFEWAWSIRRSEIEFEIPGYPNPFVIRRHSSDMIVFSSVFLEGELEEYLPEDPRFILDGGANVGFTTAYYAHRYPRSTVIAVEPSAANLNQIRRNCSGYRNLVLLEGALWPCSQTLKISNPDDASWAFRVEASEDIDGLRAYTILEIFDQYSVETLDLLKLDIEGAELPLFSIHSDQWIPRVKAIVVEIHGDQAKAAIEKACDLSEFEYSKKGEKVYAVRRC